MASTIVGLPLAFGIFLTLGVAFPLGYVMTALILGRTIPRRVHDIPAFLIGFAILRALGIIPGLGWLIGFLAAAFGVGALAVAACRAGHRPRCSPTRFRTRSNRRCSCLWDFRPCRTDPFLAIVWATGRWRP